MAQGRGDLPTGTVTFLFTDIEGSTRLAQQLDPDAYREILERHHALLRTAFGKYGGIERGTQGDAFLVIFRDAPAAIAAAVDAQRALVVQRWPSGIAVRVRMGLHSGRGIPGGDDYVGIDINRAARIAAAGSGGQILVSDATRALAERSLPDGTTLRDLGEHALKGLEARERIFQLTVDELPSDFPPLKAVGPQRSRLPPRVTSFLGRDTELAELRGLVIPGALVTLIGPGGTGKTSLAIELVHQIAGEFEEGAWFVPLETVADAGHVGSAIVDALGLREVSARPARERLIDNLADRSLILVIDNFEHVLDAAAVLAELNRSAPRVAMVVTSRAPLHLAAERTYVVGPLPLPEGDDQVQPEQAATVAAIRLFVDRARRTRPRFSLTDDNAGVVIETCRRLDGLPLGIELAAAKVGLLGAVGVRDRLAARLALPGPTVRDAPGRQRTLNDAVAWSHDLLDRPSQTLFARLAVFAGGCRPEQLEAVCGPSDELGDDILETIARLVDQSLALSIESAHGVRFRMLETIRSFALERLGELSDRGAIARRHALAYMAVAEAGSASVPGRQQRPVLERYAEERDNYRAALRWAIETGEAEVGLRLFVALGWTWGLRGELEEGRAWAAEILGIPGADSPTAWRMRALEAVGTLEYYSGNRDVAERHYRAQLEVAREIGDPLGIADALFNIPFTGNPVERAPAMMPLFQEAAAIYESLGDERKIARTIWARGTAFAVAGTDLSGAVELWQEAFARSRKADDAQYEALAASSLGIAYLRSGDRAAAARWFLEALGIARDVSDVAGIVLALPVAATAALELVGPIPAATIMGAHEAFLKPYGVRPPTGLQFVIDQGDPLGRSRARLDPAAFEQAYARGAALTPDEVADYVLELLGPVAAGRPPSAARGESG